MTALRLSARQADVRVLGHGRRLAWWTQGCSLDPPCRGCMSPQTWDPTAGQATTVQAELDWAAARLREDPGLSGVTIAGGEPSDQTEAVLELTAGLRALPGAPLDVLVFSGLTERQLRSRTPTLLDPDLVDVAILGRYVPALAQDRPLVASSNQRTLLLSDLGRARWADPPQGGLELRLTGQRVDLVGVPAPGQLDEITRTVGELDQRGPWPRPR